MVPRVPPEEKPRGASCDSGPSKDGESCSVESPAGRIDAMPKDVGWLLVTAGIVGEIAPGVIGTPFWIAGTMILWPRLGRRVESWLEAHAPTVFRGGARQVGRFLHDLDRRYPHTRK